MVGASICNWKVTSLIPCQVTCLGCGISTWNRHSGEATRQPTISFSHRYFSPSLSPFLSFWLKSTGISLANVAQLVDRGFNSLSVWSPTGTGTRGNCSMFLSSLALMFSSLFFSLFSPPLESIKENIKNKINTCVLRWE